jgi:hypothetical protein
MTRPVRLLIGVPPFLALRLVCLLAFTVEVLLGLVGLALRAAFGIAYGVEAALDFLFPRVDRALSRLGAWMDASR